MSGKPVKHQKHIPQRTCVGCRTIMAKRSLIRLVRRPEGIVVDPSGKLAGRGAYLHNLRSCWDKALKGSLARALKIDISLKDLEYLTKFAQELPEENFEPGEKE